MVGDNIYHTDPKTGFWVQENSVHSKPNGEQDLPNTEHDTQTDRVLISDEFYYFGCKAHAVPAKFLDEIGYKNGRGHRVFDEKDCHSLLNWIKAKGEQQKNLVPSDPFQFRMSDKRYSRTKNRLI